MTCAARTMHYALMRCVAEEKTVSTACLTTDSILLNYCDILLIMNRGSFVTS